MEHQRIFSLDEERLDYSIRREFGEIDYPDNSADLDSRIADILAESENISEIRQISSFNFSS